MTKKSNGDRAAAGAGATDSHTRRNVLRSIGGLCAIGASGVVSAGAVDSSASALPARYAEIDDPEFYRQYVPKMIRAPSAWGTTRGSDDVTIGILGTGVDYTHEALTDRFGPTKGDDFVGDDSNPHPDPPRCFVQGCTEELHGTKVAGIAAATIGNGTGMAGLSNSRLLNARAIPGENLEVETAHLDCPELDYQVIRRRLAAGARYLVDQGVDILNMSLGIEPLFPETGDDSDDEDASDDERELPDCAGDWEPVWDRALDYALENDVLVVSGTGNGGNPAGDDTDEVVGYPARKEGVLTVSGVSKPSFVPEDIEGAIDSKELSNGIPVEVDGELRDTPCWQYGDNMWETNPGDWGIELWGDTDRGSGAGSAVDVAAPTDPLGPKVDRWYYGRDYVRKLNAVSWAAPVVSGVAALVKARNPDLEGQALREHLVGTARDVGLPDTRQGGGLIDAKNAVEQA